MNFSFSGTLLINMNCWLLVQALCAERIPPSIPEVFEINNFVPDTMLKSSFTFSCPVFMSSVFFLPSHLKKKIIITCKSALHYANPIIVEKKLQIRHPHSAYFRSFC